MSPTNRTVPENHPVLPLVSYPLTPPLPLLPPLAPPLPLLPPLAPPLPLLPPLAPPLPLLPPRQSTTPLRNYRGRTHQMSGATRRGRFRLCRPPRRRPVEALRCYSSRRLPPSPGSGEVQLTRIKHNPQRAPSRRRVDATSPGARQTRLIFATTAWPRTLIRPACATRRTLPESSIRMMHPPGAARSGPHHTTGDAPGTRRTRFRTTPTTPGGRNHQ